MATGEVAPIEGLRPAGPSLLTPDGAWIYFLVDDRGNELGHLHRLPYEGGVPEDVTPHMPPYSLRGFHVSRDGTLLAFNPVHADGYEVVVLDPRPTPVPEPQRVYHATSPMTSCAVSADGSNVAVLSTEPASGGPHYALKVLDSRTGEETSEVWDGPKSSISSLVFSPVDHDARIAGASSRTGWLRPFVLTLSNGRRTDLGCDEVPGDLFPVDWSPSGRFLLLNAVHRAVHGLFSYDLSAETLKRLECPEGTYGAFGGLYGPVAYFASEDEILAHWHNAANPHQLLRLEARTGRAKSAAIAPPACPPGHACRSVEFRSADDTLAQGWLSIPDGEGPFPFVVHMHGGPNMVSTNSFKPLRDAFVDHGVGFLDLNQRGSTTFGREYKEMIWGTAMHWELLDMEATHGFLVDSGHARPDRIYLLGGSGGGTLALMGLGRQPRLWAGGMAIVAVADYAACYEDAAPALQGAIRGWLGGTPEDVPDVYRRSSPTTYLDGIASPVLIMHGRNDTRCPPRQMEMLVEKLDARGVAVRTVWFDGGHGLGPGVFESFVEHMLQFVEQAGA